MKILELTRAYSKSPIAFNVDYIVHVEPVVITNKDYTGDARTYVYTINKMEIMVKEDYETIVRTLAELK